MNEQNKNTMGSLKQVYNVKQKMNFCVESLSEIHNWETRIKKVEQLFEKRYINIYIYMCMHVMMCYNNKNKGT